VNNTVHLNKRVNFICFSKTPVKWTFNDVYSLPNNTRLHSGLKPNHNYLIIMSAGYHNQGKYTCQGTDDDDIEFMDHGYLTINGII